MRTRIAATGLSMLLSTLIAGCSSEPAASAAAATSTPNSVAPTGGPSTGGPSTGGPSTGGQVGTFPSTGDASIDPAEYLRRCKDETQPSLACEVLRSRVVADIIGDLRKIQNSKDKRGAKQALAALEFDDEPEIVIGACRILGRFPDTPGLAEKMLPFLDSKFIQVQSMAANVLKANPAPDFEDLGRMWGDNHGSLPSEDAYDEYPDFPAHYAGMGFPKYPGAEWFSAGDSDRSIGSSTTDDVAKVAKWYGDTLHADLLDVEKWNAVYGQQAQVLMKFDPAKMTRLQQLMERIGRGDQAATAEFETLQKQMDEDQKLVNVAIANSVTSAAMIPGRFAQDARWIIAAKKGERISRIIVVFPIPSLHRTVIKEIWDLSDFPSAWPDIQQ